jgi:hypothetical protein
MTRNEKQEAQEKNAVTIYTGGRKALYSVPGKNRVKCIYDMLYIVSYRTYSIPAARVLKIKKESAVPSEKILGQ